jgi:hypothetical protein
MLFNVPRMNLRFILALALFLSAPAWAAETFACSPIHFCRAEKKTWRDSKWETDATKELRFKAFCRGDEPEFELAPGFGILLNLLGGSVTSTDPVEKTPYVLVDIYTEKRTFVVASVKVPIDAKAASLTYRTSPNGPSWVTVTCSKE